MSAALSIVETVEGVISKKGATVADAIKAAQHAAATAFPTEAPLPGSPELPADVVQSMKALPALLASLDMPKKRRELTGPEREAILDAAVQLKAVTKGLEFSLGQIKTAVFNHFDAAALIDGRIDPDTPRTKEGWFILEDKESFEVPGQTQTLTREVRSGSATLSEEDIAKLEDDGVIDHKTYLRWTMPVRVVNEDAIMADLKKGPSLIGIVARAAKVTAASAAMYLRKVKPTK